MYTFSLHCIYVVLGLLFLNLCFCIYDEHRTSKKLYPRFSWIMAFQRAIVSPLIEWFFIIGSVGTVITLCVGCIWFIFWWIL